MSNIKTGVLLFSVCALILFCALNFDICNLRLGILNLSLAQEADLEFTLDIASNTTPLPKVFKPNIDLSGRGFNREITWPQATSVKEALDIWQKDIGFKGLYRIQYDLWEINQLSKDKELQNKLLSNYEFIIKSISDSGGTVILDLFGTPANLGRVLDKKSPPRDLRAFKALVKSVIRDLSCNKRYNVWYEVWNAPDLDDFFLGRKQDYLNLYRIVAESIRELRQETKIHILIGGPSVSWWFQSIDGNTIATPEKSLIYELLKLCYHYHLPLDFITWHGYSTDPGLEKEATIYKKTSVTLVRDWLSYFDFDKNTPLIVDEWNFDTSANLLAARGEKSFICASYIASRIKNMHEAGIDYQLYFCLEDFLRNKAGVVRNVGIFSFDPEDTEYKDSPKAIYNTFRMLSNLGNDMFPQKLDDEFAGAIATKSEDGAVLLFYNYIDPDIVMNYLSKNIANLKAGERRILLNIVNSDKLQKIMLRQLDISTLHATNKVKNLLKKALELNDKTNKFEYTARNIKISIKNLNPVKNLRKKDGDNSTPSGEKDNYLYQRYTVDSACSQNCEFTPREQKDITAAETYQEVLTLNPYSVQMIILKKKPKEPESTPPVITTEPAAKELSAEEPKKPETKNVENTKAENTKAETK